VTIEQRIKKIDDVIGHDIAVDVVDFRESLEYFSNASWLSEHVPNLGTRAIEPEICAALDAQQNDVVLEGDERRLAVSNENRICGHEGPGSAAAGAGNNVAAEGLNQDTPISRCWPERRSGNAAATVDNQVPRHDGNFGIAQYPLGAETTAIKHLAPLAPS
jgi:hypothetical protein